MQIKHKVNRKKEKVKNRNQWNKKVNKAKSWFIETIDNIDKPLTEDRKGKLLLLEVK